MSSTTLNVDPVKVRFFRKHSSYGGGMSQYELARRTGLSRSYIGDIENGRRQPRRLAANAIAQELGVTVDDLIVK